MKYKIFFILFILFIFSGELFCASFIVKRFDAKVGDPKNPFIENIYLAYDAESLEGIIIDPGNKSEELEKYIQENSIDIKQIFNSHGHFDHIGFNGKYAKKYGVKVLGAELDKSLFREGSALNIPTDFYSEDRDFSSGKLKGRIIHTPGHTEGSSSLLLGNNLFTGDTLFKKSIGRTWGKDKVEIWKNKSKIITNIKKKIIVLDENIKVYPGHGEATTIGQEKRNNPYLKDDILLLDLKYHFNGDKRVLKIKKNDNRVIIYFKNIFILNEFKLRYGNRLHGFYIGYKVEK